MHKPVPARVAIAKAGFAHEFTIRNIDQIIRDSDADFHALDFVAPLIFVGPPDAGTNAFTRGVNPRMARLVFPKGEAAEPALMQRRAGIVKINGIDTTSMQRLREVNKDRAGI